MSRAAQCALNRYERKWNVCEFPDSIFTRCAIDVVRTDVILSVTKGSIDFPLWMCQVVNRIDVQLVMALLCTTPITNGYRCWWIYVFLIFIYLFIYPTLMANVGRRDGFCTGGKDVVGRPVLVRQLQPPIQTNCRGYAHGRTRLPRYRIVRYNNLFTRRRPLPLPTGSCTRPPDVAIRFGPVIIKLLLLRPVWMGGRNPIITSYINEKYWLFIRLPINNEK